MILRTLTSRSFRNLAPQDLSFHPTVNILVGPNGQGKTNLLEAIYFLATTKSFRTNRVASLASFGAETLYVQGVVERNGLERVLSVGFELGESRRRLLRVNDEKVTLPNYLAAMVVFAYSAARLEIIRGVPEERRRFLDRGIASIDPGYLEASTRYARALKQRNALLFAIASHRASPSSLDAWNDEFALAAEPVWSARTRYVGLLSSMFRRIVSEHGYHVNDLEMHYRPGGMETSDISVDAIRARLRAMRKEELRAHVSLAGPQRDQLDFVVAGHPAAEVLSGGEVKMLVLFLKFAKLELFRE